MTVFLSGWCNNLLLDFLTPEASKFGGDLCFSIELIASRQWHENVDNHKVVVDWYYRQRILGPDDAGCEDGHLLICGNQVGRFLKVTNVGYGNHPFKGRSPEKDSKWTCRMCKETLQGLGNEA